MQNLRFILFVAKRYLFSRKKQNVINLISMVSMGGVAVGTAALIIVLSVFNGLTGVVHQTFCSFDPELKIVPDSGKTFQVNTPQFEQIRHLSNVAVFSEVVEDNALLSFENSQIPAMIQGVDQKFDSLTAIRQIMWDGNYNLYQSQMPTAIIGVGLSYKLNVGVDYNNPLIVFVPKRKERVNLARPDAAFRKAPFYVSGIFEVKQPDYDDHVLLLPIETVRYLFDYDSTTVTSVDLKLRNPNKLKSTQTEIKNILGKGYFVQDQYEQQADMYRVMVIEKWIVFLILAFILLIATFNVIGSMSMMMIDKSEDIKLFRNIGATAPIIRAIFWCEGWLISAVGATIGLVFGILVSLAQQYFGIIKMGENFIVENYPVAVQFGDILIVLLTVWIMGGLAALYPARQIERGKRGLKRK